MSSKTNDTTKQTAERIAQPTETQKAAARLAMRMVQACATIQTKRGKQG